MTRSVDRWTAARRKPDWKGLVGQASVSGMFAGLTSAFAVWGCGRLEGRTGAGPLNGPSQWLYGEKAARSRRWSWGKTGVGVAIHQVSAMGWALLHIQLIAGRRRGVDVAETLARATVTAALAATVDYGLTPKRLQPGFEKQLSLPSMVAVYAAFAAGLAVADLIAGRRRR